MAKTTTLQSGGKTLSNKDAYPLDKGERLETLYNIAVIGIVIAILILVFDIWRDNSLHTRITELERQVAEYKIDLSEKIIKQQGQIDNLPDKERIKKIEENVKNEQEILGCFKNLKYWQYEQCFK